MISKVENHYLTLYYYYLNYYLRAITVYKRLQTVLLV